MATPAAVPSTETQEAAKAGRATACGAVMLGAGRAVVDASWAGRNGCIAGAVLAAVV